MTANGPAPRVSVVICTRNRGALAVDAVRSVLQVGHDDFELVVIDQSGDDRTADAIAELLAEPRLRYHRSTTVGLARARNEGMARSTGALVAFTDDDCTVPTDWLDVVERMFGRDPRIGVVFCNVAPGPHDPALGFIPAYRRHGTVVLTRVVQKCRARGIGAAIAVRRSAVAEIGGFDPLLGAGGHFPSCEDGDMALRCLLAGWHLAETDETAVVHHGFRTWAEGRLLARRDLVGIGAAYAKPLRARRWSAVSVLAYETWVASSKPFRTLLRTGRPQGVRDLPNLVRGFVAGLRLPVDDKLCFVVPDPPPSGSS